MSLIELQNCVTFERDPECMSTEIRLTRLTRERELKRLMINDYRSLVAIYKKTFAIHEVIPMGTTSTDMVQSILDREFMNELD